MRDLRRRLQATGQDLRRTSNGYALIARSDTLAHDQRQRLERARLARRGLNIAAARLLYRIYAGLVDVHLEQRLRNPERVALGVLLKLGLVECREGRWVLPASVRTSLAAPPKPAARHRSPRSKRMETRAGSRSRRARERPRTTSHGDLPSPRG